jgi:3-oxoacyl-[acyl-carrier protein] reductase
MESKGKRAVICGASKGIGKAIAHELARAGMDTLLLARNESELKKVAAELDSSAGQEHLILKADFSRPDKVRKDMDALLSGSASYQVLINNAGGPAPGPLADAELEELADAFTMHILTAQTLMQALLPGMKEAGFGRIVNIISTSVKEPIVGLGVSNTIRGAMGNWAKTLSVELGPIGVTVNNILPGFTMTDRLTSIVDNKAVTAGVPIDVMADRMKLNVPARRFAEAQELGATVRFLCSNSAGYINGINLPVDGGRTKSL